MQQINRPTDLCKWMLTPEYVLSLFFFIYYISPLNPAELLTFRTAETPCVTEKILEASCLDR